MKQAAENQTSGKNPYIREHLANERTFLAWVRTSIGIMAFGFVIEKFALFIKRLPYLLGEPNHHQVPPPSYDFSTILGIIMVAMGGLMGLLSFFRYKKVEKEIDADTYKASIILDILVALVMLIIAIFLVFYMIHHSI
jgi:uncharacterized membrane protein YidH (DUF202 family)